MIHRRHVRGAWASPGRLAIAVTTDDPVYPAELDDLYELLSGTQSLADLLHEVATRAAAIVPPARSCGLSVRMDGHPLTQASSDDFAGRLDQIQYIDADGPCLTALREGATVATPDLDADHRWPDFRKRGLTEGLAASLSIPMTAAGQTVGALNLYATTPHAFDADQVAHRGHHYAAQAGGAVGLAVRLADHLRQSADLEAALSSRTHIDQALGIIMGQQRCTAAHAFDILSKHSQNNNIKLRDAATRMVHTVSGHPPQPSPPIH